MKELDDTLLAQGLETLTHYCCGARTRDETLDALRGILLATDNPDVHTLLRKAVTKLGVDQDLLHEPLCATDPLLRKFFGAVAH